MRRTPPRDAFAGIANPPGPAGVSAVRANAEVRACCGFAAGFLEKKLNFVQPLLDQKHVDLSRTFDPNLPPVQVDAEQLWEAILNLISNAVDAMPDGGSLTVSAQRHGAEALLSISDNGRGMTEEEARTLFVPFFTTKSDGTGLGLAYTQRVVNEHGGKINCATARGKGSTFSIQLPLAVGA